MGIFGKVNFDNPSEKEEFNNIMENWMNRQAFFEFVNLSLNFYLIRRKNYQSARKIVIRHSIENKPRNM